MRRTQQFRIDMVIGVRSKPRFFRCHIAVAFLEVRKQTGICGYPKRWRQQRPILNSQPRKKVFFMSSNVFVFEAKRPFWRLCSRQGYAVTLDGGKQEWQQSPIKDEVLFKDKRYQRQRRQQMLKRRLSMHRGGNNVSARRQHCYSGDCGRVRVANCKVLRLGRRHRACQTSKRYSLSQAISCVGGRGGHFWKLGSRQECAVTLDGGKQDWQQSPIKDEVLFKDKRYQRQRRQMLKRRLSTRQRRQQC
jgi:hypothetical protein